MSLRFRALLISLLVLLERLSGSWCRGFLYFLRSSSFGKTEHSVVKSVQETSFERLACHLFLEGDGRGVSFDGGRFESPDRTRFGGSLGRLDGSDGWSRVWRILLVRDFLFRLNVGFKYFSKLILVSGRNRSWSRLF